MSPGPARESGNDSGGIHFCKQSLNGETILFLRHCPDAGSLRTDLRCWGHTVTTGRWRGHSWHL